VIEALQDYALPSGVEVIDGGTGGLGLVNLLTCRQRVIIVDAANMGLAPGRVQRFTLDEARLVDDHSNLSAHGAGLRETLLLAQTLGSLPDEVVVYGVQPRSLDWENGLSEPVEAVLSRIVDAILDEMAMTEDNAGRPPIKEQEKGRDGKREDTRHRR
jgi:hydrogenase maturation protease